VSRWLGLKTKEGELEKYAIGFVSHTVSKAKVGGKDFFEAWRIAEDTVDSVQLGCFDGNNALERAKLCVENDMRELLGKAGKAAA